MAKKKALGKGLSEIFTDDMMLDDSDKVNEISIDLIKPNPDQPRKEFDEESLDELASSIKHYGIIQPILVRKTDDIYFIIAGERRFRAAKMAKMKTVPCIVRDIDDARLAEIAMIENIQREDLNPIEEAEGYKFIMSKYGKTQNEVSDIVHKSRTYVTNILRLLKLSDYVKNCIYTGKISQGHARALLSVNEDKQKEICDKIIENELSVRDVEKLVKSYNEKDNKQGKERKRDKYIVDMENRLSERLSAKINIKNRNNRGKIEISYANSEEFYRLLGILGGDSDI